MKHLTCSEMPEAKLVALVEGDLLPEEAEDATRHIDQCQACRESVKTYRRSLDLVKQMWQKDEAHWQVAVSPGMKKSGACKGIRRIAVAAAVFLLLSLGGMGLIRLAGDGADSVDKGIDLAELEFELERAALGRQMLAVADLLSQQTGGAAYAVDRYRYVIEHYERERQTAQTRLQSLLARSTIP